MAEGMWLPSILNCSLVSWFQGTDSGYMVPSIVKCTKIFKYQSTKTRIDNLFSWNICYWTLPRSKFPFIHLKNVLLGGYAVYISLRNQYSRYIVWGKPACIHPFERTNQATTFFFFWDWEVTMFFWVQSAEAFFPPQAKGEPVIQARPIKCSHSGF